MVMGAASFGGFGLLLPVVPLVVSRAGGSDALAGSVTAVFMAATVATQLTVPALLRRFGHRAVLAAGCLFLGLPSLAFLVSTEPGAALVISAVRGIGFGLLTVASAAIVAELSPPRLLGRATGAQGIAVALSQSVALPAGLAIDDAFGSVPVFVLGAVVPVAAVAAIAALPSTRPAARAADADTDNGRPFPVALLIVPCLAVAAVSAAFGGVSSLLPISLSINEIDRAALAGIALSVASAAALIGRYGAGVASDRLGPGRALAPSLALTAAGLALVAYASNSGAAVPLFAGAVVFGIGYGACQNDSLVMTFAAAGPTRISTASAAWNISFDAGTGVGALGLGILATGTGYPVTFACGAAVVGVVAAVALADRLRA